MNRTISFSWEKPLFCGYPLPKMFCKRMEYLLAFTLFCFHIYFSKSSPHYNTSSQLMVENIQSTEDYSREPIIEYERVEANYEEQV